MKNLKTAIVTPLLKNLPGPYKQKLKTNTKSTLHLQTCGKMHAQTTPG